MFNTFRMRWISAFVAAALLLVVRGGAVSAPATPPRTAALDAVLQRAVARGSVPGVVAAAADRNGIVYRGAAGRASSQPDRPMAVDAIFGIASMTKAVTSVALMQLVDEKKVGLDAAASEYLPPFAKVSVITSFDEKTGAYTVKPASRPITIRHLLTHTSGLGYSFTSPIVRDFKPRNGDAFEVGPLLFEPGADWVYGTSTDWIGRLVEAVSGKDLDAYFRERIFAPLGMRDTHFNVPETALPRLAPAWRRQADGTLTELPSPPPQRVTKFNGGGGLSSTAADYIRFLQMLLNGGQLDGARILSAASVDQMSRNQIGAVNVHAIKSAQPALSADFSFVNEGKDKWSLGFQITGETEPGLRSAGSLSWGGINNTYFWLDPSRGVAGVILMQFLPFADASALSVYRDFERAVYEVTRPPA
jgi:methyl acetate hydrolase